jgi:diacylglycerol O-acyltransferase / wax synthase
VSTRMGIRDASFLYLERPNAHLQIGCVAVLERSIGPDALRARLAARLPARYRQRAVDVPFTAGHPSWEDDPDFDLRNHLRRWTVPRPGGPAELCEAVASLLGQPLERSRPLWEMHLLEGLDGDRCAMFQAVHHCMLDGMAGAQLLDVLLDRSRDAREPRGPAAARAELPDDTTRLARAVTEGLWRPVRMATRLAGLLAKPAAARSALERLRGAAFEVVRLGTDQVPEMPWNRRVGPRRLLAFARLPLEGVRRIRRTRGGTVNDVALCAVAGGLHRYLRAGGYETRGLELTAAVPVSLRSAEEARSGGNRISAVLVPLAVDVEEEIPRLAATRALMDGLKARAAWVGIDALLDLFDQLPPALVAAFAPHLRLTRIANLIATNVPGPRETRYLCGARVEALYPIVPIFDGIGLGIAIFSYDGWLHLGLNADADAIPDLDKLRSGIEDAFASLEGGA